MFGNNDYINFKFMNWLTRFLLIMYQQETKELVNITVLKLSFKHL